MKIFAKMVRTSHTTSGLTRKDMDDDVLGHDKTLSCDLVGGEITLEGTVGHVIRCLYLDEKIRSIVHEHEQTLVLCSV